MQLYCELLHLWIDLSKPGNVDEIYRMTYHKNHQGDGVRLKLLPEVTELFLGVAG